MENGILKEEKDSSGRIWLTIFSDMMTNLMLFFLMLYGITRLSSEKQSEIMDSLKTKFTKAEISEKQIKKIVNKFQENQGKEKIENLAQSEELKNEVKLEMTNKTVKVTLNIPVFFASGDAAIQKGAVKPLFEIGKVIAKTQNKIIVEGHTDNLPVGKSKYSSNWELSVARAGSVIEFFTKTMKILPERFILAGYGEMKPVTDNLTPEGRMKNRRIEINILKSE